MSFPKFRKDQLHKFWIGLFFVGCLTLLLGSQLVCADVVPLVVDFDKEKSSFDSIDDKESPDRLPLLDEDANPETYFYQGLVWTRVGVVPPGSYYDTNYSDPNRKNGYSSDNGYTKLTHRDGNLSNVAYNDAGLTMTISIPEGTGTGAFQFLGGLFLPAHYETGMIRISGILADTHESTSDVFVQLGIGKTDLDTFDWEIALGDLWREWFISLEIQSVREGFTDKLYDGNAAGSNPGIPVVFDDLRFNVDWEYEGKGNVDPNALTTPEPASLLLVVCGGLGLLAYRRKRA